MEPQVFKYREKSDPFESVQWRPGLNVPYVYRNGDSYIVKLDEYRCREINEGDYITVSGDRIIVEEKSHFESTYERMPE
jgi:hypothetical protein